MTEALTISLAQLNPTVGDLEGNVSLVREARQAAAAAGADLVVAPELVVSGYPPEDLVLKPAFQDRIEALVEALAGVRAYPVRVKCAVLSWHTLKAALEQSQDAVTTE